MSKASIMRFLATFGKADTPDFTESAVELFMDDHFYFIDDDLQGWFIKEDISILTQSEEIIHDLLKELKES